MNKKLVALAVGSAFALPLAAQAQTANVTLYGRLNLDLEFVSGKTCANGVTGGAGSIGTATGSGQSTASAPSAAGCQNNAANVNNQLSNTTTNRVSSNTSRFGMRGTESLGGGLNAIFQIESNVSGDTGNSCASGLATRETFVGLQGGWGRFVYGSFLMPQDDVHLIFGNAPTLGSSLLATSAVWGYGNLSKYQGGFDTRLPNSVRYDSPNMMGFTAALQYSTFDASGAQQTTGAVNGNGGTQATNINHANVVGGNVIYSNGPFQAGASFEINNKVRNFYSNPTGGPNLRDYDWTVTGSYNFGTLFQGFGLQIGAVYERTNYEVQAAVSPFSVGSGCLVGVTSNTCNLDRNFYGVSGTIPLGGGKIYLFYGKANNGSGNAPDGTSVGYVTHGSNTSAQHGEISYSYNLSPRTMLYTGFTEIRNQCKSSYTFNINAYAIAVGQYGAAPGSPGDFCSGSPKAGVFGIVHFF
jgi:predicted porin